MAKIPDDVTESQIADAVNAYLKEVAKMGAVPTLRWTWQTSNLKLPDEALRRGHRIPTAREFWNNFDAVEHWGSVFKILEVYAAKSTSLSSLMKLAKERGYELEVSHTRKPMQVYNRTWDDLYPTKGKRWSAMIRYYLIGLKAGTPRPHKVTEHRLVLRNRDVSNNVLFTVTNVGESKLTKGH